MTQHSLFAGRYKMALAISAAIIALGLPALNAAEYEKPQNKKASEIIPPEKLKGPHYTIGNTVIFDDFLYTYTIDSDFGKFEVTGNGALKKMLKEIEAIAALKEIKKSDAFASALKESASAPVKFGQNLIKNPGTTLSTKS